MSFDSKTVTDVTIRDYNEIADSFWEGTKDHDVSQNINALLSALGHGKHSILDFGCGPGRDVMAFKEMGHKPVGLDGCINFVNMAKSYTGCDILHQDFLKLDLPASTFDGVFANASMFHIPSSELPQVLERLHCALKPNGVLFSSNPRGANSEGWNGARFGAYHDLVGWNSYLTNAGFTAIDHYYRPQGLPREHQPWLASTWRKYQ